MNPEKDPTTSTSEQQEDKANQIRVLMSDMQRTIGPDESYNLPDAARNGLGGSGSRAPQFAAVPHGPQNVEGHPPPPQHIAEPHGPRHEFQYDMDPRAPHYSVDPVDLRMPQFGVHSAAPLYAAESRAPQRVGSNN